MHRTLTRMLASPAASRSGSSNRPPGTRGDDNDNDDSASQQQQQQPLRVEEDEEEVARAAAAVSVMAGGGGRRQRPPGIEASNAAIQGTALGDGGEAQAFEVVDEGGELVRVRFHEFLQNYSEIVNEGNNEADMVDEESSMADAPQGTQYFPYVEQASQLAHRQLKGGQMSMSTNIDDDDEDAEMSSFCSTICVNFRHLLSYDPDLAEAVEGEYVRFEHYLRRAAKEFVLANHPALDRESAGAGYTGASNSRSSVTSYFVAIYNAPSVLPVRALRTGTIGRFSSISGTVTRTSDVRPELLVGSFRCRKCGLVAPDIMQQYHLTRPPLCRNPRCHNRNSSEFHLEVTSGAGSSSEEGKGGGSEFVDWQRLRVQENADEIPPGSMPRTIDVIVRNEMVERAKAGDRVVLTGSLVVVPDGSALARAGEAARASGNNNHLGRAGREAATGGGGGIRGLAALGVRELTYRTCFVACCVLPSDTAERVQRRGEETSREEGYINESWLFSMGSGSASGVDHPKTAQEVAMEYTEEEKEEIRMMKAMPNLYSKLTESIAPATFGHTEVKRGILLMLLSGVHKTTSEGMRLRGDINVCIVGDPSTAKSQFLKFVHSFLPERCVYTSGKAASAAGLTAAVVRDQDTGEYCIEAGALMLADNGICCIDEFDKMDQHDQVAIHEAMEQQTISITKAGIQATLNARASILAAANPIHGRYDRSKTLRANVQLSAPILSRFDLFFVVLDECDDVADYNVAKHIIDVHRCDEAAVDPPFSQDQMLRYIRFARTLNPQITEESRRVMVDCYRKLRQGDTMGRSRTAYRITVRQLESLIRLSEALARLHCDDLVKPSYVREAFRLLRKSIIHVETEDVTFDDGDEFDDRREHGFDDDEDMADEEAVGESQANDEATSQAVEADNDPSAEPPSQQQEKHPKSKKLKKKKTQISFEQYGAISNAISTYLRSKESEQDDTEGKASKYLTWGEVAEWYLEQCESDIGDSLEELQRKRKLTNLVIRRLVQVDHVLMCIGSTEAQCPERCVYTSGKAASAAGLTAAVVRDQDTGEYCIEAGALMLADNGICCIDEFDKMDQHDQVAIHEAMEQQTISITKAGIQATLNARASILAAANPIHGRYDRSKTLRANVQLSAPILSRFDLFFVVLDECDDVADYNVAKHIIDVHRCDEAAVDPPFSQDQMLRYIRFARTLNPQITEESRRVMVDCYRKLRQGDTMGRSRTAYRITVRQLESLIRLSEALARLHCDDLVKPSYVREAFRLLRKSIIHVETEDVTFDDGDEFDDRREHGFDDDEGMADEEAVGESQANDEATSQAVEADNDPSAEPPSQQQEKHPKSKKLKKKKTQISFEQYGAISNAISTYLRSKESEQDDTEGKASKYLTWGEVAEWYLEQCESDIGDSLEELQRKRKLTNLVIRRLVQVDHVLMCIGSTEGIAETDRKIAVHPNYAV